MNRAAALAFGIPLLATICLLTWRERGHSPARVPPPVAVPAPSSPPSSPPAKRPSDIVGRARVVDGDTLEVTGVKIRLKGIDAPEAKQSCGSGERLYLCGDRATAALREFLRDKPVVCKANGTDVYGRMIATCYVGDTDVNQWLVTMGWAVAFRRYSLAYVAAEVAAKAAGRGLWADTFEMPWDYRARMRGPRQ